MKDLYQTNTLIFNKELCNNCRLCTSVCPHSVFERIEGKVYLVRPANCMECGACQLNCTEGAITVDSGVGCASAMIYAAFTGKKKPPVAPEKMEILSLS